jgi:hypothetical protein
LFVLFVFFLQLYNLERDFIQTTEGLIAARAALRIHLQSSHFGSSIHSNNVGQLVLRCSAQIGTFYQEVVEKELGITQRDPIPAKGEFTLLQICIQGSRHFFLEFAF